MPVWEFYYPDLELIQSYLCAWVRQVWRKANLHLFQDEDLNAKNTHNTSDYIFNKRFLLYLLISAAFFVVDWAGHLRSAVILIIAHFRYKERQSLMTSFRDYSICWINDVHFGTIMTTGRLARECLFARYRLLMATGLSETASRLGVSLSVGSVHVVFQHPVYLLTPFVVDSAVVAFDARAIYIEQRIARLRDEVTVAVVTATQVVTSDTCTIFDILRCLDTPGCRLPSPLPPPSVKACALVEAETRDMLRREIEQCRQGKRFWNLKHERNVGGPEGGKPAPNVAESAPATMSQAARHLCLQERLRLAAQ